MSGFQTSSFLPFIFNSTSDSFAGVLRNSVSSALLKLLEQSSGVLLKKIKNERQPKFSKPSQANNSHGMTNFTDQELVQGILKNSSQHQWALYQKFSVPMFRVLLRFAKDRAEAEDMLQDGFVRVYRDMAQFRSEGALGGWIRRIMVNTALSHLRKQRDFLRDTPDFTPFENLLQTHEDFGASMDAEKLMKILQQLPPGYRAVFNLYAVEGFTHEEIAQQLGITIGTSKSQLFKARDFLKKLLEKQYDV